MKYFRSVRWWALAVAGVALSGCVTLFPKVPPAQLYRFEITPSSQPPEATQGAEISVIRAPTTFAHGAAGDQLLTVNGDQVAYIASARWIAPAVSLFDQAESEAFDQSATRLRLARRGEIVNAPLNLRLDVESFETRYLDGPANAPAVVVRIRAILTRSSDHKIVEAQTFESRKPAGQNRVAAIVSAYSAAVTEALGAIVTWTETNSGG